MGDDLDDLDDMGPVDYLVIEFPRSRLTGEGLPLLVDLVDRNVIHVLDLVFVKKLADGTVTALNLKDLERGGRHGLAVFAGASSGLVGGEDLTELGGVLEAGSSAAVVVYENVWAAPLARALKRSGARLVAGGRVPVQNLLDVLDAIDAPSVPGQRPVPEG